MPARKSSPVDVETDNGLDARYVESFLGYNTRRATLAIGDIFMRHMAVHALRPVDFTLLALIARNPGVTSSQLCDLLDIQSSNLVTLIAQLQGRRLITRRPHPRDGRAMGLHLTTTGGKKLRQAEATAVEVEERAARRLSATERDTLIRLLRKVYARESGTRGL